MLIQHAINQYCTAIHTPGVIRCMATKEAGCGSSTVLGGGSRGIPTGKAPNTTSPPPPSNALYIIKTSRCLEASEGIEQIIESSVRLQTLCSTRQDVTSEDLHIFPSEKLPRKSNQGRNSLEKKKKNLKIN